MCGIWALQILTYFQTSQVWIFAVHHDNLWYPYFKEIMPPWFKNMLQVPDNLWPLVLASDWSRSSNRKCCHSSCKQSHVNWPACSICLYFWPIRSEHKPGLHWPLPSSEKLNYLEVMVLLSSEVSFLSSSKLWKLPLILGYFGWNREKEHIYIYIFGC